MTKSIDPQIVTVLGGGHFTNVGDLYLGKHPIDFIVRAEGEITMRELVRALDGGNPDAPYAEDGLSYFRDGEVVYIPMESPAAARIPRRYRRPKLTLSKIGLEDFDFGRHNATCFAGLENSELNCYVNAALQLLFFVPPCARALLRRDVSTPYARYAEALAAHEADNAAAGLAFLGLDLGGADGDGAAGKKAPAPRPTSPALPGCCYRKANWTASACSSPRP